MAAVLPLPQPGDRRGVYRRVVYPQGILPIPYLIIWPTPLLYRTHWCPGMGRTAPCLGDECPRCADLSKYPPQPLLVLPAVEGEGRSACTLVCPGHIAWDVVNHANYARTWLGMRIELCRAHKGKSAAVLLTGLYYPDSPRLPHAHDPWDDMRRVWAAFLPPGHPGPVKWKDRDPGEEG